MVEVVILVFVRLNIGNFTHKKHLHLTPCFLFTQKNFIDQNRLNGLFSIMPNFLVNFEYIMYILHLFFMPSIIIFLKDFSFTIDAQVGFARSDTGIEYRYL